MVKNICVCLNTTLFLNCGQSIFYQTDSELKLKTRLHKKCCKFEGDCFPKEFINSHKYGYSEDAYDLPSDAKKGTFVIKKM
jgi:hypothetical protein